MVMTLARTGTEEPLCKKKKASVQGFFVSTKHEVTHLSSAQGRSYLHPGAAGGASDFCYVGLALRPQPCTHWPAKAATREILFAAPKKKGADKGPTDKLTRPNVYSALISAHKTCSSQTYSLMTAISAFVVKIA